MFIDIPVKEQYALEFYVGRPDGGERTIYVNPYTGDIQGEKSTFDLRQLLRELHGWLLIPFTATYSPGLVHRIGNVDPADGIVDHRAFRLQEVLAGDPAAAAAGKSGKPRLLGRFPQARRTVVDPVHRNHERYGLVVPDRGLLADSGYKIPGEIEHPIRRRTRGQAGPIREAVQTISLDRAIEIARGSFPGLTPAYIELPTEAYHPIEIAGRSAYPLVFQTAYISPYSGKVISTRWDRQSLGCGACHRKHAPAPHRRLRRSMAEVRLFLLRAAADDDQLFGNDGLDETLRSRLGATSFTSGVARWFRAQRRRRNEGLASLSAAAHVWRRWWFHLSALMVLVPVGFLEQLYRPSGDAASRRRGGFALG